VGEGIPSALLKSLTERITEHYFELYSRFRVQYPKSAKRYSTFKIDDLDHPEVEEIVINYFKEKVGSGYADYANLVLGFSLDDLKKFEKNRELYHNR
jgi:hypothetical protein